MIKNFLFAGIVVMLSFSSCKKDKAEFVAPPAKLLKKITQEGYPDAILSYDNNSRLVLVKSADNSNRLSFSYDAAGLLTKMDYIDIDQSYSYTIECTYANGIPVSGTYKEYNQFYGTPSIDSFGMTYTVTNNQVTKIHCQRETSSDTYLLSYKDGELAEYGHESGFSKDVYTYGSHKSAFPKVTNFILDVSGHTHDFGSNHELLTATYHYGTNPPHVYSLNYTFDAEGYVLTRNDGFGPDAKYVYE